jgi:hypothetical protein
MELDLGCRYSSARGSVPSGYALLGGQRGRRTPRFPGFFPDPALTAKSVPGCRK